MCVSMRCAEGSERRSWEGQGWAYGWRGSRTSADAVVWDKNGDFAGDESPIDVDALRWRDSKDTRGNGRVHAQSLVDDAVEEFGVLEVFDGEAGATLGV